MAPRPFHPEDYGWTLDGLGQEFVTEAADLRDRLQEECNGHSNGAVDCALRALVAQTIIGSDVSFIGLRLLRLCQAVRSELESEAADAPSVDLGRFLRVRAALDAATALLMAFTADHAADIDPEADYDPFGH